MARQILVEYKKARLNYEILEAFEAGIELLGFEVKALKAKQGSLEGAHVVARGNEAFLVGAFVPPYQQNNTPESYDPNRNRKLLLKKEEIERIAEFEGKKGLTIVPIMVYNIANKVKVEIAVARGKKKFDKREDLKKRTVEREIRREVSDR